ncbi:hypothetical protein RKE29_05605 [Streptomyces sp. B1866]|uniref:hypothetical protein n=1 Tax=Streptomyces sp. B1866 TaxID=3075431 RepID=UPI002890A7C4|nr:hypothetical protein [Streptomyces sp. B1866]MDT3396123.1 hypothetical protein [Streptomyces sp. B1866]
MHRTPSRLPRTSRTLRALRALAVLGLPALLAVGCSSGSGGDDKGPDETSPTPGRTSASPTLAPGKYAKLPAPCSALPPRTVDRLVPRDGSKHGKSLPTTDSGESGSCLWSRLDGYQYRSLTVSLRLLPSDPALGAGETRARDYAAEQAQRAATAEGLRKAVTGQAQGIGDAASTVRGESKKDGEDFRNQTVIARAANVVVTVELDGAGYEDAKTPDGARLLKDAQAAAEEALAAVERANS